MKKRWKYIIKDWKKTKVWFAILIGIGFFFNAWYGRKIGLRENIEEYICGGMFMLYLIRITEFISKD